MTAALRKSRKSAFQTAANCIFTSITAAFHLLPAKIKTLTGYIYMRKRRGAAVGGSILRETATLKLSPMYRAKKVI